MGARLAKATLDPYWASRLSPDQRVVLTAMALTALDTERQGQEPGIYWGGWEYLWLAYKGELPEPGTPGHRSAQNSLRRMLQALRDAGAIEMVEQGSGRRRSRYKVTPANYKS